MNNLKPLSTSEFKELIKKGYRVADFRSPNEFSLSFIPGSIYIHPSVDFKQNIADFLYPDQALLIVAGLSDINQISRQLFQEGFNNIAGYLEGGFDSWRKAGNPVDVVISISSDELLLDLKYGKVQVIDIRPKSAYDLMHIEDSDNFPAELLIKDYDLIDTRTEICLICQDGTQSMSLISYLKINNVHNIYHLEGGFNAVLDNPDFELVSSPTKN